MSDVSSAASNWITALIPMIAYFLAKSPEDYTYAVRNSEDCWYPPTCAVMTNLIPRLTNKDQEYDKTNAIADANNAVNTLFQQFKDDTLVQVYQPMCIANGYNSTTMQLLVDHAYAKTVSEGAKLQLDNIQRYSGIRVGDLSVMAQLIGAIRNSLTVGDIYRGQKDDFTWISGLTNVIADTVKQTTAKTNNANDVSTWD